MPATSKTISASIREKPPFAEGFELPKGRNPTLIPNRTSQRPHGLSLGATEDGAPWRW
jgi:hypothetical protein